jgi:uncharacterized protein (DUF427 family)
MKAIWRGQVIAESDRTLDVGDYRYFPRETVRMDLLRTAPKTQSDLACPNGVQFYFERHFKRAPHEIGGLFLQMLGEKVPDIGRGKS